MPAIDLHVLPNDHSNRPRHAHAHRHCLALHHEHPKRFPDLHLQLIYYCNTDPIQSFSLCVPDEYNFKHHGFAQKGTPLPCLTLPQIMSVALKCPNMENVCSDWTDKWFVGRNRIRHHKKKKKN